MAIRQMRLLDYEEIKKLVFQVHELHLKNRPDIYTNGNPLPLSYFEECLNNKNSLNYVYEWSGNIIGLIIAKKSSPKDNTILKKRTSYFIEDIVVDSAYRRKGIGKELYYAVKEQAKLENVDSIELNVWAFNEEAIQFYISLGMNIKNIKLEETLSKVDI